MISVLLPVRDNPDLIRMALDSVLAQTGVDFEVVVVDDASGGDTADMLGGIADSRVRVATLPRRGGVSRARNTGLDLARGDHIAFIDAGDAMLPDALAGLVASSVGADMVVGGYQLDLTDDLRALNASGEEPFANNRMEIPSKAGVFSRREFPSLITTLLDGDLLHPVTNKLYGRDLLRGIRFDETVYSLMEDELFNLAVLGRAERVTVAPLAVALVDTTRPGSLSQDYDDDRAFNLRKLAAAYAALDDGLDAAGNPILKKSAGRQIMLHYLSLLGNLKKTSRFAPPFMTLYEAERLLDDSVFMAAAKDAGIRREQLISTLNAVFDFSFAELRRASWLCRGDRGRFASLIDMVEKVRPLRYGEGAVFTESEWGAGWRREDVEILAEKLWTSYDE